MGERRGRRTARRRKSGRALGLLLWVLVLGLKIQFGKVFFIHARAVAATRCLNTVHEQLVDHVVELLFESVSGLHLDGADVAPFVDFFVTEVDALKLTLVQEHRYAWRNCGPTTHDDSPWLTTILGAKKLKNNKSLLRGAASSAGDTTNSPSLSGPSTTTKRPDGKPLSKPPGQSYIPCSQPHLGIVVRKEIVTSLLHSSYTEK